MANKAKDLVLPRRLIGELASGLEYISSKISSDLVPYISMDQFHSLTPDQLDNALNIVRIQKRRLAERRASIFDVDADREEFNVTLSDLKLLCVDDILQKFEGGDIIEIYDCNFRQMYHNWIFHYYCSYDLLTLVSEPIFSLYSRPEDINKKIVEQARHILEAADGPVRWDVPTHFLKEAKLKTPRVFKIDFQWACPVRDPRGRAVALVSTNKCVPTEIALV